MMSDQPQPFGKYLLFDQLQGALGRVHRAFDTQSSEVAVIKRPPKDAESSESVQLANRFRDEVNLAYQLSGHKNIVRPRESSKVDGEPYLALEWIAGKDLRKIEERARRWSQPIPPGVIAAIVFGVCDALAYAYGKVKEFAHRDISLGNIIVGYDGVTRLIDFGLAISSVRSAKTMMGQVPGTQGFTAPERGEHNRGDLRSDLYSLAAVFALLWNRRLYYGLGEDPSLPEEFKKHFPLPEPMHPAIERFFWCSLAKDPNGRPQSVPEFKRELQTAVVAASGASVASEADVAGYMAGLFSDEKEKEANEAREWQAKYGTKPPRVKTLPVPVVDPAQLVTVTNIPPEKQVTRMEAPPAPATLSVAPVVASAPPIVNPAPSPIKAPDTRNNHTITEKHRPTLVIERRTTGNGRKLTVGLIAGASILSLVVLAWTTPFGRRPGTEIKPDASRRGARTLNTAQPDRTTPLVAPTPPASPKPNTPLAPQPVAETGQPLAGVPTARDGVRPEQPPKPVPHHSAEPRSSSTPRVPKQDWHIMLEHGREALVAEQYGKAIQLASEAEALGGGTDAIHVRALAELQKGDFGAAKHDYQRITKLSPDDVRAKEALQDPKLRTAP